ncbi:hypothetical protein [Ramlibacter sp. WS9]|uniref:hypothetical protein n=1 Tax=Ramlibacter sp. WS9 TaxID=1882741 RepID=UPI0011442355|nr:hypothetical protein [Ramlibacter sp. WS9]ROZ77593.1 hypothetical protein EEB15_09115 [Ramlibacter sp. WS9]
MSYALVLQEYLAQLKESGELDELLPTLLSAMGFEMLTKPQVGVRQYGSDLPAVGVDEDGSKKLFVFVIKCGDIGRHNWEMGKQAVRPSINELADVWFRTHVPAEFMALPRKVVLVTNGEIKQELTQNWTGFQADWHGAMRGELTFWGTSRLVKLIEEHLFDEFLFTAEAKSLLRRALATLDEPEASVAKFAEFAVATFDKARGAKPKLARSAARLVAVGLAIYVKWSTFEANLRPALLATERTYLLMWNFLRGNSLQQDNEALRSLSHVHAELARIGFEWWGKFVPYYRTEGAFAARSPDAIFTNMHVFEHIGILSLQGLMWADLASRDAKAGESAELMAKELASLLDSHTISCTPAFDHQTIDILLGMILLARTGRRAEAIAWLKELIRGVKFARQIGRYAPCSSDALEDLIAMRLARDLSVEKMTETSILLPAIALLCAAMEQPELYAALLEHVVPRFEGTTLQVWHPDATYEDRLDCREDLPWTYGISEAPYPLPDSFEEFKRLVGLRPAGAPDDTHFDFAKHGLTWLPLIASRTYRGPIPTWFVLQAAIDRSGTVGGGSVPPNAAPAKRGRKGKPAH